MLVRRRETAQARNSHERSFIWRKECALRELYMGMLAANVTDCGSIQSNNSVSGFPMLAGPFGDGIRYGLTGLREQTIEGQIAGTSEAEGTGLATRSRQVPQQPVRQM